MPRACRSAPKRDTLDSMDLDCVALEPTDTHCRALKLVLEDPIWMWALRTSTLTGGSVSITSQAGRREYRADTGEGLLVARKNTNPTISRPMDQAAPEMSTDDGNSVHDRPSSDGDEAVDRVQVNSHRIHESDSTYARTSKITPDA